MAVSAYHGAVKSDFAHVVCRDGNELRGEEILLGNAVHIVEKAHNCKLYAILALVCVRSAADEDIESLAGDTLGHGLFHLVGCKMRQKVSDDKARLARLTADRKLDGLAALERDNAVKLKRNGDPLILFYAAVVMSLEVAELVTFIHAYLLEVKARRVNMSACNNAALCKALFADHGEHERLTAIILIYPHAGLELHAEFIFDKALLLGKCYRVIDRLALGTGDVEVAHVLPAVFLDAKALLGVYQVIAVFLLIKELASKFVHIKEPPQIISGIFL